MANQYETFRQTIIDTIAKECVKTNGQSYAYDWSMSKAYSKCGEACDLGADKLPTDFKTIVSFEVGKLKDKVMSGDSWQHLKSSNRYVYSKGTIEMRRTDTYGNATLSLEQQLTGALDLFDKAGKQLAKSPSEEQTIRINKRLKNLQKEIDYLRGEIAAQDKLRAELTAKQPETTTV